jgi:hypothetical protein
MGMLSVVCNPVPTGNKASRVDNGNLVLEFAPRRPFCTSSVASHRGGTFCTTIDRMEKPITVRSFTNDEAL